LPTSKLLSIGPPISHIGPKHFLKDCNDVFLCNIFLQMKVLTEEWSEKWGDIAAILKVSLSKIGDTSISVCTCTCEKSNIVLKVVF